MGDVVVVVRRRHRRQVRVDVYGPMTRGQAGMLLMSNALPGARRTMAGGPGKHRRWEAHVVPLQAAP